MMPEFQAQLGTHDSPAVQNTIGEQPQFVPGRVMCVGRITHVDPERWTVNVDFEETNQNQSDIPIASPYFNHEIGQGAYFIPETGARCVMMYSMDTWFIIGYLPPMDYKHIDFADSKKVTQSHNEEFLKLSRETFQEPSSDESTSPRTTSYRNKRESNMREGDYCVKTRAFNKSKWFTDGNILHESTKLCYRVYSKLKDRIIDFCVNLLVRTPGGDITWTNDTESFESDYKREVRQLTTDPFTSYLELIGHDSDVYTRIVRHWEKIDGSGVGYLPDEGGRLYLPEHFYEHIQEDGRWVRQVNHNFVEMNELTEGEPYTDKKSMYYELVEPTGEWDKRVEWREGGGPVTINYHERVAPSGEWTRWVSQVDAAYTYRHIIDPAGNQNEHMFGQRTLIIHLDDDQTVLQSRVIDITQDLTMDVGADQTETVGGQKLTTVSGEFQIFGNPIRLN